MNAIKATAHKWHGMIGNFETACTWADAIHAIASNIFETLHFLYLLSDRRRPNVCFESQS